MRILIAALVLVAVSAASIQVARSHATLQASNPPAGGAVRAVPREVVLEFTERVEAAFSRATVANQSGAIVSGRARVSGNVLRVPMRGTGPGAYTVSWRVVSVDTHPSEGSFTFWVSP